MPIYEFACDRCRKVFQFYFRSARSRKRPACPKCGRRGLSRHLSGFAVGGRKREADPGPVGAPDMDPAKLERAMAKLEREMASVDEEDPRQMGHLMRRVIEESGTDLGPEMETALRRLEAGEDPERIEEDMGEILDRLPGAEGGDGDYEYDDSLYEA